MAPKAKKANKAAKGRPKANSQKGNKQATGRKCSIRAPDLTKRLADAVRRITVNILTAAGAGAN